MKITEAIDSVVFKHALFEGKVEFDYVKNDGTLRHAVGTMNEALLPKVEPVRKFDCSEIVWENAGDVKLPKRATVCIAESVCNDESTYCLDDLVFEALEKRFGHIIESFEYEEKLIGEKKMSDGSVFYYDLEKKGFRSFKLANLKGWKSC